jgi:AraC family transcriptional regulator, transcriptional activator of pobA
MAETVEKPEEIALDELEHHGLPLEIVWLSPDVPSKSSDVRATHRHDYHELFVLDVGAARHRIDGEVVEQGPGSVLLIGRGQTHVLESARGLGGVVVRFTESVLSGAAQQASPGWFLVRARSCVMHPPPDERLALQQLLGLLGDEMRRPADARSTALQTYHLSAALLLVDRWQGTQTPDVGVAPSPEVELFQRFARLLEAEFTEHHDAGWYADQLAVTPNHLARTMRALTGRSTKGLIGDRLMTEGQRLLRHTSLTVQQIAHRLGYADPLYFSRAFRRHLGKPPSAYRSL